MDPHRSSPLFQLLQEQQAPQERTNTSAKGNTKQTKAPLIHTRPGKWTTSPRPSLTTFQLFENDNPGSGAPASHARPKLNEPLRTKKSSSRAYGKRRNVNHPLEEERAGKQRRREINTLFFAPFILLSSKARTREGNQTAPTLFPHVVEQQSH